MKVLIIGGGIGGLTTAVACQHFNIDYEVFEAAPEIRELGAGIWVPPNAMQVMHRLGLNDVISANGKYDNPDYSTLTWIVEAAKSADRNIEIVMTNSTDSIKKLKTNYKAEDYGYTLTIKPQADHSISIPLS